MNMKSSEWSSWQGTTALVTGASSGIGEEFARVLAGQGADLVLVARREDRLKRLADELRAAHGVRVQVEALDLAAAEAPIELHRRTREAGLTVDLLVNNAGFGLYGPHMDIPWEREAEMLQLDIVALARLTRLYLEDMLARGRGRVIQLASIGAYQPSPTYAAYAAAKAYVLSFGEALDYELRGSGVCCTVLSPGVTRSEFLAVSGQPLRPFHRLTMMSAREVVEIGLRASLRGRPSVIPGVVNKLSVGFLRLVPRRWQAALAHWTMTAGGEAA